MYHNSFVKSLGMFKVDKLLEYPKKKKIKNNQFKVPTEFFLEKIFNHDNNTRNGIL